MQSRPGIGASIGAAVAINFGPVFDNWVSAQFKVKGVIYVDNLRVNACYFA